MSDDEAAEYRLQSFITEIHERRLRGIVVNSSVLDGRTERRIDRELSQTEDALEEAIEDLEERYFECEPDAVSSAEEWLDDHDDDLFTIDSNVTETEPKKSRDKPGRPPKDWEPYETVYQVEAFQTRDEEVIATYKAKESCFVVGNDARSRRSLRSSWTPVSSPIIRSGVGHASDTRLALCETE